MLGNLTEKESSGQNRSDFLSNIEKDTIGEILNISMGSAATAISTLISRKVIITTPKVSNIQTVEFDCSSLQPAIGIEIEYIEGISGSSYMIMKKKDVKALVNILLANDENIDDNSDLDDIHISAISEIMNQMMGASCTALANFFGRSINISTPMAYSLKEVEDKIVKSSENGSFISVKFNLKVEGVIDSEFLSVMTNEFAHQLAYNALNFSEKSKETEQNVQQKNMQNNKSNISEQYTQPNIRNTQSQVQNNMHKVSVAPVQFRNFDEDISESLSEASLVNFNLLLSVPLDVTVEIGRTKKQVKDILEIRQGSIIEFDKQSGDPVDIIVNGQLIAKGDVVVIDDNFGVRVTEIISNKEILNKFN